MTCDITVSKVQIFKEMFLWAYALTFASQMLSTLSLNISRLIMLTKRLIIYDCLSIRLFFMFFLLVRSPRNIAKTIEGWSIKFNLLINSFRDRNYSFSMHHSPIRFCLSACLFFLSLFNFRLFLHLKSVSSPKHLYWRHLYLPRMASLYSMTSSFSRTLFTWKPHHTLTSHEILYRKGLYSFLHDEYWVHSTSLVCTHFSLHANSCQHIGSFDIIHFHCFTCWQEFHFTS